MEKLYVYEEKKFGRIDSRTVGEIDPVCIEKAALKGNFPRDNYWKTFSGEKKLSEGNENKQTQIDFIERFFIPFRMRKRLSDLIFEK